MDKKTSKDYFDILLKCLPLLTIVIIFIADWYQYLVFENFGINILAYSEASELIFLFIPSIATTVVCICMILSIILFLLPSRRKALLLLIGFFFIGCILNVIIPFLKLSLSEYAFYGFLSHILIYMPVVVGVLITLIKQKGEVNKNNVALRTSMILVFSFLSMFPTIYLLSKSEAHAIDENKSQIKRVIVLQNRIISTGDSTVFLGETKNFIFLKHLDTTTIIKREDMSEPIRIIKKDFSKDSSVFLF